MKKENDPFSFLFKQFSSLEFKEHQTIKSLIKNYYPLNKDEEIFIENISIKDKNEFISQIKKIFHELSISMETIEYIFNEYYHFIENDSQNNPFGELQKSEVINKFGTNSNMYKKILDLYIKIINNLKDNKNSDSLNNEIEKEKDDVEMKDIKVNDKEKKKIIEQKIANINSLSDEMKFVFEEYNKKKKESNTNDNEKKKEEDKKNNNNIYRNIVITPEKEEVLKSKLKQYENMIA